MKIKWKDSLIVWGIFCYLLVEVSYLLANASGILEAIDSIQNIMKMAIAMIVVLVAALWLYQRKKGNFTEQKEQQEILLLGILFVGIVLRIGYFLYTGADTRVHDIGDYTVDGGGQAGYLLSLLETKHLPQNMEGQNYQQPLFYILAAISARLTGVLTGSIDVVDFVDAARVISCFAGCFSLFVARNIIKEATTDALSRCLMMMVTAMFPATIICGGALNVDTLSFLFLEYAFLYTIYWSKDHSYKNMICLGIIYGLGMMTKISMAGMALFTGVVFWFVWHYDKKEKKTKELLSQFLTFGMISVPLGIWYSLRNYVKFGQKIGYVLELSKESELYTGRESFFSRFLSLDIGDLLQTPFAEPFDDYNLPVYTLKSAAFGEYTYDLIYPVTATLLLAVMTVLAVVVAMEGVRRGREIFFHLRTSIDSGEAIVSMAAVMLFVWYILSAVFYIKYPFGCSMDARNSLILSVFASILVGSFANGKKNLTARTALIVLCVLYMLSSVAFFLNIW